MKNLNKILLISVLACGGAACQSAVTPVGKLQPTPAAPVEKQDDSAAKIDTVQQQGFIFVYVFRRKDGAVLDSEDRKFLRTNSPPETNQWRVTEDERAAIAGSNYQFSPENLENLKTRFAFENRSKPREENVDSQSENNANAAVNKNENR